MSRLTQLPTVGVDISLKLTEPEMRALEALAGYGSDSFLKVFYQQMGRAYIGPHEAGLRSLFETIKTELPPILRRADAAKKAFMLRDPVIRSRKDHDELIASLSKAQP